MRVAEDHGGATEEAPREPLLAPRRGPGVVRHADSRAAGVDDEVRRQQLPQRRLVGVSVYRVHRRPERLQLLQYGYRRQIAAREDQGGAPEPFQTRVGEPSRTPG